MNKIAIKQLSIFGMALLVIGCQSNVKPVVTPSTNNVIQKNPTLADSDEDGINDVADQCPKTPNNVAVNDRGCTFGGMDMSLKVEGRIFYPNNQTAIPKKAMQISPADTQRNYWQEVTDIAKKWHEYPNAMIYIEGHASISEGESEAERMELSKLRASIVKYTLIHQFGIAPSKFYAVGYGANRPIADDTTIQGSDFNRRVYIMLSNSPYFIDNLIDKKGNTKPVANDGEIAD